MTDQNTNISGREGITDTTAGHAADTAKTLIGGITPAQSGWVLGFICVVGIIVGSDALVSIKTLQSSREISEKNATYLTTVETNRAKALEEITTVYTTTMEKMLQQHADASRRNQETIRDLVQSVARDSERAGAAALQAIQTRSETQAVEGQSRALRGEDGPGTE